MADRKKKTRGLGLAASLLGGKAGIIAAGVELATPLVKTLVANFNDPHKRAEILAALPKINSGTDNSAQGLAARAEGLAVQLRVLAETADKPGEAERLAGFQQRLDALSKAVPFAAMSGKGAKKALRQLGKNYDALASDIFAALVDEVSQLPPDQIPADHLSAPQISAGSQREPKGALRGQRPLRIRSASQGNRGTAEYSQPPQSRAEDDRRRRPRFAAKPQSMPTGKSARRTNRRRFGPEPL